MTRGEACGLAGVGIAAVLAVMLSPLSPLVRKTAPAGQEGQTWAPDKPAVPHYARGGLFHPPVAGQGRTGLIRDGWAWICDPPSERTGPGGV